MKLVGGPCDGMEIRLHPLGNYLQQEIQDQRDFLRFHVYRVDPDWYSWNFVSYYSHSYYREYDPELWGERDCLQ